MRFNRPGVYQAYDDGMRSLSVGNSTLEVGAKAGLLLGAIKGIRAFNKGRRQIVKSLMKRASDESNPVYSTIINPNTKLVLNVAAGKSPGRIIVSYIKGGMRKVWSHNSLEKKAVHRPIDNINGMLADSASLAVGIPAIAMAYKAGIKHPTLLIAGGIGASIGANILARKALDLTTNKLENHGLIPNMLTKVDPNSSAQILLGNGALLAGGIAGVASAVANPIAGAPTMVNIGLGAARARLGMDIGEAIGTAAGYLYDRGKEIYQNRQLNNSSPLNTEPVA